MRVVGGTHRGRRLAAPPGSDTRPTADRVREAVFNMLGPVDGLVVLDLFAGSGAMGIEALSRGAASAVFVDRDARATACIARNLSALGCDDRARVVRRDWRAATSALARAGGGFGLCLVDPPYSVFSRIEADIARALTPLIPEGGSLVIEGPADVPPPTLSGLSVAHRTDRTYGSTRVTVARLGGAVA